MALAIILQAIILLIAAGILSIILATLGSFKDNMKIIAPIVGALCIGFVIYVMSQALSSGMESSGKVYVPVGHGALKEWVNKSRLREQDGCPTDGVFNDDC